jgi:RNA polymerase sigma-70 factor (ECF subfamily)
MVTMTAHLPAFAATAPDDRPASRGPSDLSDETLMARLSSGDAEALDTLYNRYGDLVYSTALRVLRDVQLAEDVSQEVFVRLWRQPGKYAAEKGSFVTWLLSVTRNRAVDWLRKRRRRFRYETASPEQQQLDIPAGEAHDPALTAQLLDTRRVIKAALACLPLQQRRAIELAYFGGYTNREVALLMGAPLGTVKTRIRLGMMRLREVLRPDAEATARERGSVA